MQRRYTEAEPLYKRALSIREKTLGKEHPETAVSMEDYSKLLRMMNREDEANKLEAQAKQIREKTKPKEEH